MKSKIDYLKDDTGLPKSDVIKFYFDDMWIVFRPSGTEPKIKMYISIKRNSDLEAKETMSFIQSSIDRLVASIND